MNENTKKYTYWAVGVVVAILVIVGIVKMVKNNADTKAVQNANTVDMTGMQTYSGMISRTFQGEHMLNYSFAIPETATATVSMNNALVRVTDNKNAYASIYFSYEGSRKYSAEDYINKVIKPRVPKVTIVTNDVIDTTISSSTVTGSSTSGMENMNVSNDSWTVAQSTGSEWHVTATADGQWLVVIESPKMLHDQVEKTVGSFSGK
jgi:hypothetical protein